MVIVQNWLYKYIYTLLYIYIYIDGAITELHQNRCKNEVEPKVWLKRQIFKHPWKLWISSKTKIKF